MLKEKYLEALKGGMKGELESITLYEAALGNASDPEVRKFFELRIEEEKRHFNYLLEYFNDLSAGKPLNKVELQDIGSNPMITETLIERIADKQILFSAISTALLLEKNAFEYYRKCAEETDVFELKVLFHTLSEWETRHYDDLIRIEKEAEVRFWRINRFEPF